MEENKVEYQEKEIAEHFIKQIKTKREEGFTDEQIAKDLSLPLEVVQRCDTSCSEGPTHPGFSDLPDNPAEDDTKKPFTVEQDIPSNEENNVGGGNEENIPETEDTGNDSGTEEVNDIPKGGTYSIPKTENTPREEGKTDSRGDSEENGMGSDNIDVKEEYTLEQSVEDMFSDDSIKNLKAEFAQCKIRHSKLVYHIAKVMTGEEEDIMPLEMLQIKADAMQTYLTCLGVEMKAVKNIEKAIKEKGGQN